MEAVPQLKKSLRAAEDGWQMDDLMGLLSGVVLRTTLPKLPQPLNDEGLPADPLRQAHPYGAGDADTSLTPVRALIRPSRSTPPDRSQQSAQGAGGEIAGAHIQGGVERPRVGSSFPGSAVVAGWKASAAETAIRSRF